jgi:hypothetical protein
VIDVRMPTCASRTKSDPRADCRMGCPAVSGGRRLSVRDTHGSCRVVIPTRWLAPGVHWLLPVTLAGVILLIVLMPVH